MSVEAQLFDDKMVQVDERTALLGGSFYFEPIRAYSPLPLRWCWNQLIRYPSATLIDVGASTGCYSLLSAHHPDLTVWAFEPVPLTYDVLTQNVLINKLQDKVTCIRKGVSNYNGVGTLHSVVVDGGKGVSIVNGEPAYHKVVEDSAVQVVTLDTFCALHDIKPTFLKIDCEGSEQLVLEGARKIIEKYHPFLLFEYSQENANQFGLSSNRTIEMIEKWNYIWSNPEQTDIWAVPIGWETIHAIQTIEEVTNENV